MKVTIISGGQTGADRGGLEAAVAMGVPYTGWIPKDRRSEDGCVPEQYVLQESPEWGYRDRTLRNVLISNLTLIFTWGPMTIGSRQTKAMAEGNNVPCLWINTMHLSNSEAATRIVRAVLNTAEKNESRINVAGSRESKAPGIQEKVRIIMSNVIMTLGAGGEKQLC